MTGVLTEKSNRVLLGCLIGFIVVAQVVIVFAALLRGAF